MVVNHYIEESKNGKINSTTNITELIFGGKSLERRSNMIFHTSLGNE